jgi:precorrin-6A/cobalt-precorrin-6A reductase
VILLLGGTTEALPIARALVAERYPVLLSTATDLTPRGRFPEAVERIAGMLNADGMAGLISLRGIRAVVDATHPFAAAVSENAWQACRRTGIPYFAWERPGGVADGPDIHRARDHEEGAVLACSFNMPVLLTIGVRNLSPYLSMARKRGVKLVARVLDTPESIAACRNAGFDPGEIVGAAGPFSVEENFFLIQKHHIGVLVTKDSGDAGGVGEKVSAALKAGCRIVVIRRPKRPEPKFQHLGGLMAALGSVGHHRSLSRQSD